MVFGKFCKNDEATMQMLKVSVVDEALKEEINLDIEHSIKASE